MKFTLKDYQSDALGDILTNLRKARRYWHLEGDRTAFSLTATTGAGKTVIAAAVFEALFYGEDAFEFEPDPGAVVIWFSDDPTLNEQTRFRLLEAADRLDYHDLVVVQNSFNREKFQPGKVYFLNTHKLGKKSLLVRGHDAEQEAEQTGQSLIEMRPDLRSYTIWDTIQNTIEDPDLTLYLVLDEAHRGMGGTAKDKSSIVLRLINGSGSVEPIPVVFGISATVERFNQAMKGAAERTTLTNVLVDPAKVQESGLLKDTIVLDIPAEAGAFDTVLVRRATDKIRESTALWAEYAEEQEEVDPVTPLMVIQVPNTPDPAQIGHSLDIIREQWPELGPNTVAHVFGEHRDLKFGQWVVPYISPERVQETPRVRVLIAKDAISTGWDCPRAEVMVSFRPAVDRTHITQLLGRMVRTPLARRVPGNDKLNSVECLLPFFDAKAVSAVADTLMNGDGGEPPVPGRRVLINPVEMTPNDAVTGEVWEKFLSLPSQSLPRKSARPVKRLTALAQELAADALLPDAGKLAHGELHKILDAARARYSDEIAAAVRAVHTVEGQSLLADLIGREKSFQDFVEEADAAVIEDAYRRAARSFSPDLARTYADYLAAQNTEAASLDDALLDAHADVAAMGLVPEVKEYLDEETDRLAKVWLDKYRVSVKRLSDERQDIYRQIKEMSTEPQDVDLTLPGLRMESTTVREANGDEYPLPKRKHHLLADSEGDFPVDLNQWEMEVLDRELARPGLSAWYRNPSRASQDSLAIAYREGNGWKAMRPDFVFFYEMHDGSIGAAIVDPHGYHFADSLPKLRGLAEYAEKHQEVYHRVEALAKVDDRLRVLDLTVPSVRKAIAEAEDAKSLYGSSHASDY
ncbi:DEAD/DEAH box helicase [Streptomyces sp. NPDC020792]|uniref:DEAD/DEAH box helicase n=1 Tax=Streptomyces sp. NPDC020792 TaxID=3365089 RepID=UPI0037A1C51A